ncbi:MAG: hypothetical protein WA857_09645, partial [Candidatus Acidiferrum sp.]
MIATTRPPMYGPTLRHFNLLISVSVETGPALAPPASNSGAPATPKVISAQNKSRFLAPNLLLEITPLRN